MIHSFRRSVGILLVVMSTLASAQQRTLVAVADFANIPVSLGSTKALTAEQVHRAFLTAAAAERWDVVSLPDGRLQLSTLKSGKHTVVIEVTYDATSYSARYVSSEQLFFEQDPVVSTAERGIEAARSARDYQTSRFARLPESKYAVRREHAVIHPSYEVWMHDLLGSVRRQLTLL